jgi:lipopolysaccharide/colanic/teichoic acid biosynthesis glycosyltransferase
VPALREAKKRVIETPPLSSFALDVRGEVSSRAAPRLHLVTVSAKRAFDILGAATLLVLLLPILLSIALLIRLTSPGPVLFRQQRVGRGGRLFCFYKFRTMYQNTDPTPHREYYARLVRGDALASVGSFKLTRDPRVTSFGRLLRRSSLDEIPQLLHVLKGDMSLVGPRPPIPYEVELYSPREMARLRVTPGLTGLWQVSGRSTLNFQQMVELDLAYIKNWSLQLDLKILLKTPWAILTGKGAV